MTIELNREDLEVLFQALLVASSDLDMFDDNEREHIKNVRSNVFNQVYRDFKSSEEAYNIGG